MTEQKEETKPTKPLTLSTTARAGAAKSSDATQVRQKFSHGRTRAVTVEVKKPVKRPGGPTPAAGPSAAPAPQAPAPAPTPPPPKLGGGAAAPGGPPRPMAPGVAQTAKAALRRPPMRPTINKRLPQPPGARREVPKRRSDKVDVGRAVEGENDFRSRSAAQMRRRLERDRRREHDDEPQQKVYREATIPDPITLHAPPSPLSH